MKRARLMQHIVFSSSFYRQWLTIQLYCKALFLYFLSPLSYINISRRKWDFFLLLSHICPSSPLQRRFRCSRDRWKHLRAQWGCPNILCP